MRLKDMRRRLNGGPGELDLASDIGISTCKSGSMLQWNNDERGPKTTSFSPTQLVPAFQIVVRKVSIVTAPPRMWKTRVGGSSCFRSARRSAASFCNQSCGLHNCPKHIPVLTCTIVHFSVASGALMLQRQVYF